MANKNHKLPDKLVQGGEKRSHEARVPTAASARGNIGSNMNIRWTPRKKTIAAAVLGIPFLLSTFIAFKSGYILAGILLIGLGLFVGLMYLALRYIDNNEF